MQNGYIFGLEVKKARCCCCCCDPCGTFTEVAIKSSSCGWMCPPSSAHISLIILISGCAVRNIMSSGLFITFYDSGKLAGDYLDSLKLRVYWLGCCKIVGLLSFRDVWFIYF